MELVNDENQTEAVASELIKRTPIENTPFVIISIEGKNFGTFGQYKITEDRATIKEVENELKEMNWNRLVQIMTLVNYMLNNTKIN